MLDRRFCFDPKPNGFLQHGAKGFDSFLHRYCNSCNGHCIASCNYGSLYLDERSHKTKTLDYIILLKGTAKLILDKNGWAVWDIEELDEEITIDNADKLELDFKVIKNEVYVCFKGPINLEMTFYISDYNGNNYYKNEVVIDYDLDVDFKVKVFNSIDGGEVLEDVYLELFTEQR